jgi:hypothetical protein
MTKRRQAVQVSPDQSFKGPQFTAEVILWAVRWYLMFPISYRDLELMLLDRGVEVDHTTIFRWIQAYAVETGEAHPAAPAHDQRLLAGGRDGVVQIRVTRGGGLTLAGRMMAR